MAKLHFLFSTMNAGKSAHLLQVAHNYEERGMRCLLLTAAIDTRHGSGVIASRTGLRRPCHVFREDTDILAILVKALRDEEIACILVDEAQFLSRDQVLQLARIVDEVSIPVMAYGLRTDFLGHLFEGSAALLALADEIREVRTICHCGKKATMVLRKGPDGQVMTDGEQIQIGDTDTYESVCRKHWFEATGR